MAEHRHITVYKPVASRLREHSVQTGIPISRLASEAITTWLDVIEQSTAIADDMREQEKIAAERAADVVPQ